MSPEEKELFSASCFGQFLDHPKITESSKIINRLMMRVGDFDGVDSDDALYIVIGREPRAFTAKQFVEITGLRYIDDYNHCDYSTDVDGSLYKEIFLGGVVKNRRMLTSMLNKSKSWENTQKRVKLLMLHFLTNILLTAPAHTPIQNMSWAVLVEDLDQFNNHQLGIVAWNVFHGHARKYVLKMASKVESKQKINFSGFVYPLQVWAYECLPLLTSLKLCQKVSEITLPLMRRWKTNAHVLESRLKDLCTCASQPLPLLRMWFEDDILVFHL